jgi:pyruvate kinase
LLLVLKIETREAVRNLPRLIIHSADRRPTAVMIVHGDLAVELGHPRFGKVQEATLRLCEAVRIPVIWTTQVLDEIIKDSLPSRTEIINAAMSQRTACAMLNKGPHVIEEIAFLSDLIGRIGRHQSENRRCSARCIPDRSTRTLSAHRERQARAASRGSKASSRSRQ